MSTRRCRQAARFASAFAVLLSCLSATQGVAAADTTAGIYTVRQCDFVASNYSHEFSWESSPGALLGQHPSSGCAEFGLGLRNTNAGSSQVHGPASRGGYFAYAPPGTAFTAFSGSFGAHNGCCISDLSAMGTAWQFGDESGLNTNVFDSPGFTNSTWMPPSGSQGPVTYSWDGATAGFEAQKIGFYLVCASATSCSQNSSGDVRLRGRSFEFALRDNDPPTVESVSTEGAGDVWLKDSVHLDGAFSDVGGGLALVSFSMDGGLSIQSPIPCATLAGRFVELQPCPLTRSQAWDVDTTDFADGIYEAVVRAVDVGGAVSDEELVLRIDNGAPVAPTSTSLAGGEGWRATNSFSVSWASDEEQHAPIAKVHYSLCPEEAPGDCLVGASADGDGEEMSLAVPSRGSYLLSIWLEDEAGNSDPAYRSGPLKLRFDDEVPGSAAVSPTPKWIGGMDASGVRLGLGLGQGTTTPVSGIGFYWVTTDGTDPGQGDLTVGGDPAEVVLEELPEGETEVRARAVSNSGVASNEVGSTVVKVDRSAPSVAAAGLPDPGKWMRAPVSVQLTGSDQPGLSGMGGAPAGDPVEDGGHLVYELDGAPEQKVRGPQKEIIVSGDGSHTLSYRAVDVAGNASVEKQAEFKIDRTPPQGSFERQDPADPRRISVAVFDALSGIAGGQVELRLQGTARYEPLATSRAGGRLVAHLDDLALPKGRYELRARVWDVAGNTAVIDRWEDGGVAALAVPLRLATRVEVVGQVADKEVCVRRAAPPKKKRKGKKRPKATRRRCIRKVKIPRTGATVPHGYGKRAMSTGRVTTAQGRPIPGAAVVVEAQLRSGGAYSRIGTATANHLGEFEFAVPTGASRTIRYRFQGTKTIEPATAQIATRVPAAVRLRPSKRRLLNGQAVVFRGQLLGKPIPSGGKVVALQAKVGREWRTFATPRANSRGAFKHRYRFTATTGLRRYAFRAVATREAAYSYERGASPTVSVIVRGR